MFLLNYIKILILHYISYKTVCFIFLILILIYHLTVELKEKRNFISKYPLIPILRPVFKNTYKFLSYIREHIWVPYTVQNYLERRHFIKNVTRVYVFLFLYVMLISFLLMYKGNTDIVDFYAFNSVIIFLGVVYFYCELNGSSKNMEVILSLKGFKVYSNSKTKKQKKVFVEGIIFFIMCLLFFEVGIFEIVVKGGVFNYILENIVYLESFEFFKNLKWLIELQFHLQNIISYLNSFIENIIYNESFLTLRMFWTNSKTYTSMYFEG